MRFGKHQHTPLTAILNYGLEEIGEGAFAQCVHWYASTYPPPSGRLIRQPSEVVLI